MFNDPEVNVQDAWGKWTPKYITMPCGSVAEFDYGAGYGYRCLDCMAVIGSMGQPKACVEEQEKHRVWAELGGKDWEYFPEQHQKRKLSC